MPAMTNPDDYYQRLINEADEPKAYKGSNGLMYCPECKQACKLFKMDIGIVAAGEYNPAHYHCFECGEIR